MRRQRIADDREESRGRHARPRHHQHQSREHPRPRRRAPVRKVTECRCANKSDQGSTSSKAIAQPAARILIDAVQKVLRRAKQTDGGDRRTEGLEILRQEPPPQAFAQAHEADGGRSRNDRAVQGKIIARRPASAPWLSLGHKVEQGCAPRETSSVINTCYIFNVQAVSALLMSIAAHIARPPGDYFAVRRYAWRTLTRRH